MAEQRILIIDDDEDILETTGALLEHEGFGIFRANTVELVKLINTHIRHLNGMWMDYIKKCYFLNKYIAIDPLL